MGIWALTLHLIDFDQSNKISGSIFIHGIAQNVEIFQFDLFFSFLRFSKGYQTCFSVCVVF